MPVVVPVAGDVGPVTVNATVVTGTGGATITPGQWLYTNSGKQDLAVATSGVTEATVSGVAITASTLDNGIVYVAKQGTIIDLGVSLTEDQWYSISSTAGAIEPVSDSTSGDYRTWVGFGDPDGNLYLAIINTDRTKT